MSADVADIRGASQRAVVPLLPENMCANPPCRDSALPTQTDAQQLPSPFAIAAAAVKPAVRIRQRTALLLITTLDADAVALQHPGIVKCGTHDHRP